MVYYLFRAMGMICPLLPTRFGYWLFARLGDVGFLLTARPTTTYIMNLRHVLGVQATERQLKTVARRGYQNLFKNYFDLFRAHRLTKAKLDAQLVEVKGLEYVQGAIKRGKGVVGGSGHFGAWDMVLHLIVLFADTRVVTPQEHLKPEKLFRYIQELRKGQGMNAVPIESAPREIIKALRAGGAVGLAFDRDITKSGQIIDFFGAPARLPDGAVQLEFKYDCAVIVGFALREADNRVRVVIEPPLKFERTGNHERDLCNGVRKIAQVMERYIRQYPEQWLMFQKVWVE
jgi:Kdo2-lipid IVA lauroyltransferase/acyltransferase